MSKSKKAPRLVKIDAGLPTTSKPKEGHPRVDSKSLAHTKWNCKYHIVFTPKYRRKAIYGQYRESIREILGTLCKNKGEEILEGQMMMEQVHLVVGIAPKMRV